MSIAICAAPRALRRVALAGCLFSVAGALSAAPLVDPNDRALRHDLQLVADAGLLAGPLTTWPLSLADLERLEAAHLDDQPPHVQDAARRLQRYLDREARRGEVRTHARLAAAKDPLELRHFGATPREEGELELGSEWTGERFTYRLNVTAAHDPEDDRALRFDGSYAGVALGNWMLSAGAQERWWGPGWEGSLILGTNARPVPGIAVQRTESRPFDTRWLSWMGPWQFTAFAGQLESDRHIPEAKLIGARLNFKPTPKLEIGLSRTAQWGGEGRPQTFSSLIDLMIGKSNTGDTSITGEPIDQENVAGNQLAGYDFRWTSPIGNRPYALYGQMIGEDEANNLPSQHMGLFGVDTWGGWGGRSYRLHLEYADTTARFASSEPNFNTAYEHSIYQDGYRYRGRALGHAMDGDGRMWSLGLLVIDARARSWQLLLRHTHLNRDGSAKPHGLAPDESRIAGFDLVRGFDWHRTHVRLGAGADRRSDPGADAEIDTRVFAEATRRF